MKKVKAKVYNPSKIESKLQKKWASSKLYKSIEGGNKDKYYTLDMFPYPSGEGLHVGHPKGYIATDIISRTKRMQGFNVLHPMGFDAFGLPAENYALKTKTNPMVSVAKNVKRYKKQLEILGFDYDWSREINTTDPKYYKWTQWIFLQLLEKGLAYESYEPINWCPSCKTGLANEDVEDGRCERCGTIVEKKPMRQWVLKITDYAERLLADLDLKKKDGANLLDWPEAIKTSQKNWIGKSEGSLIKFKFVIPAPDQSRGQAPAGIHVQSLDPRIREDDNNNNEVEVFTTRPDTLFGVTYVVLAPEHEFISKITSFAKASEVKKNQNACLPSGKEKLQFKIENWEEVEKYINQVKNTSEIERTDAKKEKTGVELKGIKVINPANNQEVPLWVADYVLPDYGTGAVMAVPAHDERDWEFAKKYGLEVKQVIAPYFTETTGPDAPRSDKKNITRKNIHAIVKHWSEDKYIGLNWIKNGWHSFVVGGVEDGEKIEEGAMREIREETGYKNIKFIKKVGPELHTYHYVPHKDENRYGICQGLYFELVNDEKDEIEEHEKAKHEICWIEKKEMINFLNLKNNLFIWDNFLKGESSFDSDGILINSEKSNNKNSEEVKKEITEFVGGKWVTKYKLRDWVFSRQRYWGEPIPVIHCNKCGIVPVPEKDLPVKLPKVKSYEPTGTGESPLASIPKWVNVKCPVCNSPAKRETNTMPQWAGSSWYYLRYVDPKNNKVLASKKNLDYWCGGKDNELQNGGVDLYVGGAEHATRHLIYARFWHKFLYDIGIVSNIEPFLKLQHVGLIIGEDGRKMSKRFGNVINPDEIVKSHGADSLRLYEMFMGPFDQQIAWSTNSIAGVRRFIEKVWRLIDKVKGRLLRQGFEAQESLTSFAEASEVKEGKNIKADEEKDDKKIEIIIHKTIKKVTEDIEAMRFNTAISAMMIAINEIEKSESIEKDQYENILKLLAPFAPHFTEELWTELGNKKSIHLSNWPQFDASLIVDEELTIMVQVNGKIRGSFVVKKNSSREVLEQSAKETEGVKKWLEGKSISKVIVVVDKLVNIVIM